MTAPAVILTRAATVLRERANGATQGPWALSGQYAALIAPGQRGRADDLAAYGGKLVAESITLPDRRYLATISPDVGLILADWLDKMAELAQDLPDVERRSERTPLAYAVAISQAILREVGER